MLKDVDAQKIVELKSSGGKVAVKITIKGKEDEETAIKVASLAPDYLLINCPDWKIIPLENLIARTRGKTRIIAEVSTVEEAKIAVETLELGVDGVLLKTLNPEEVVIASAVVKKQIPSVKLTAVKVKEVRPIGTGARACVDTCDIMRQGEGLLVGCQSSCLFLVEAEVHENPFVQPRPFRVNAGPVSLYVLGPLNRTRYLSELKAGEEILIVDRHGNARVSQIGRVKIEWRPLIIVEAEHKGKTFKTIAQNAETIRLVTENGSIPVTNLKAGDTVLTYISEGGRHFGTLVKEEMVVEF